MSTPAVENASPYPESQPGCEDVSVYGIDDQGRGVASIDGRITRIDGALAGELVRIRRQRKRRRCNESDLVDILKVSPDRATPSCPHYAMCGGCRFQHLSETAQRERKTRMLMDALARHFVSPPESMLEPLFDQAAGYRRKARLGVRYVPGKGGALVGFREKRSNYVTDLSSCEVLVPAAGRRIQALRALVSGLDARDRIPQIEVAAGENATAFVIRHLDPLSPSDIAALTEFAIQHDVHLYLQPGGPESLMPLSPSSPPPLMYALPEFELEFAFQPMDFVQVNAGVNRRLVARAVSLLELQPEDRVLDLYCGIGNFSLAIGRRAAQVVGAEFGADMVRAAEANAARNGFDNITFARLDLENADTVASCLSRRWDKLMLDPPRSGAAAVVAGLGAPYPGRIVYVSCNPETFARDAANLVNVHGYEFERAGIVDMFPHTGHVEAIGAFVRRAE